MINAWCNALVTAARSDCGKSPRYKAAIMDANASPKLTDNCCSELAMVAAMLACSDDMSA